MTDELQGASALTSPPAAPPPAPVANGAQATVGARVRVIPTLAQIQAAQDIRTEDVPVPEWGPGAVIPIRGLTGTERDRYEADITKIKGGNQTIRIRHLRAKLVVLAAVDDGGSHLFTEAHLDMLSAKSAAALDRLFTKAAELSGMSDKDIDELEEQLGKGQSA